jgi:hypothetical protein
VCLTLLTGSIWDRASWGAWWSRGSNQLVLFLFYSAYSMLRFSIEEEGVPAASASAPCTPSRVRVNDGLPSCRRLRMMSEGQTYVSGGRGDSSLWEQITILGVLVVLPLTPFAA